MAHALRAHAARPGSAHHAALQREDMSVGIGEIWLRQRIARQSKRTFEGMRANWRLLVVRELRQPIRKSIIEIIDHAVAPPGFALHVEHDIDAHRGP